MSPVILAQLKPHCERLWIWLSINDKSGDIINVIHGDSSMIVLITKLNVFPNPVGRNPKQCLPLTTDEAILICSVFASNDIPWSHFFSSKRERTVLSSIASRVFPVPISRAQYSVNYCACAESDAEIQVQLIRRLEAKLHDSLKRIHVQTVRLVSKKDPTGKGINAIRWKIACPYQGSLLGRS